MCLAMVLVAAAEFLHGCCQSNITHAISAGAPHNNKPSCRCLQEDVSKRIGMAEVASPQDRIRGRVICQWWQKNTIFILVFSVCTAEHRQEGKIQILANVVALPGGGGMPLHWPKLLIPMHVIGHAIW
jgi:hypothetical protein